MFAATPYLFLAWSPAANLIPANQIPIWPVPAVATTKSTAVTVTPTSSFFTLQGAAKSPLLEQAFERECNDTPASPTHPQVHTRESSTPTVKSLLGRSIPSAGYRTLTFLHTPDASATHADTPTVTGPISGPAMPAATG